MARRIIAKRLYPNDRDAFFQVHWHYISSLRIPLVSLVLAVEIIIKITTHYFESYFKSADDFEYFLARLKVLQNYTKQMFDHAYQFDMPFFLDTYTPYTENKWDEYFLDMQQGLKSRIALIRHVMSCYTIPDLSLPIFIDATRLSRMLKEVKEFRTTMADEIARIEEYLDEDFVEAFFIEQDS